MTIQRYDIDESKGYPSPEIVPDDLGDYVRESDYLTLEAELEKVKAERDEIRSRCIQAEELNSSNWAELATKTAECERQRDVLAAIVEGSRLGNFSEIIGIARTALSGGES